MKLALNNRGLGVATFAVALLAGNTAFAHIDLLEPEARAHGSAAQGDSDPDPGAQQKSAPCGQEVNGRTDRIATYEPGETITVTIREETNHPSYFRVWLQPDGDGNIPQRPTENVASTETLAEAMAAEMALDAAGDEDGRLLDVLVDDNTESGTELSYDVTLPDDVTCENCTLQIIQFMYDADNPFYYQCADLVIAEAGAMAGGAGAGGMGGAGSMAAGSGGATMDMASGSANDEDDGGCSLSPLNAKSSSGWALVALLGLGAVLRRRRS